MLPERTKITVATGIVAFLSAGVLLWWIFTPASYDVVERVPGMDNRPPQKPISDSVIIGEYLDTLGFNR